ncbi:unnamed protein product [Musa banksii]
MHGFYCFVVVVVLLWESWVTADPQTTLLSSGCNQYNASDTSAFVTTLNETLADLRSSLSSKAADSSAARFATAQQPPHCRTRLRAIPVPRLPLLRRLPRLPFRRRGRYPKMRQRKGRPRHLRRVHPPVRGLYLLRPDYGHR